MQHNMSDDNKLNSSQLSMGVINSSRFSDVNNPFQSYPIGIQVNPKNLAASDIAELPFEDSSNKSYSHPKNYTMMSPNRLMGSPIRERERFEEQKSNFLKSIVKKSFINEFRDQLKKKAGVFNIVPENVRKILKEQYLLEQNTSIKTDQKKQLPLFQPQSAFILIWEFIQFIQILLITWWCPYLICFEPIKDGSFDNILIYTGIIDIFIKCNKSIIQQGQLLLDRKQVLICYIRAEAAFDILSFIILIILSNNQEIDIFNLVIMILQVYVNWCRLSIMVNRIQESYDIKEDAVDLIKVLLIIFYFAHFSACIWFKVGFYSKQIFDKSWIDDIDNSLSSAKYNYAFYWATMTMVTVGYGDITPKNQYEMVTCNIIMFLSTTVFAFSMNSIGIILKNINDRQQKYRKAQLQINSYMKRNQVPIQLQSKIRNFLRYQSQLESQQDDQDVQLVLDQLSSNLRQELAYEIQSRPMKYCKLFYNLFSEPLIRDIALNLETQHFTKQDIIYSKDHYDEQSFYIIQTGQVELYDSQQNTCFQQLNHGDYFGEYEFFTGQLRICSARCVQDCQIFKISRLKMMELLKYHKYDQEKFHQIKEQIISQQSEIIKCYACQQQNHCVKQCPYIQFIPDIEQLLRRQEFIFQDRSFFKRKIEKSLQSLASLYFIQQKGQIYQKQETQQDPDDQQSISNNEENNIVQEKITEYEQRESQQSITIQQDNRKKNFKQFYSVLNSKLSSLQIKSINRDKNDKNDSDRSNNRNIKSSQPSILASITNPSMMETKVIQLDDNLNNYLYSQVIDKIQNYRYFFPNYNLEQILKQYNKNNKYYRQRLGWFTKYTFFFKPKKLIWRFLIRKNNRRSRLFVIQPVQKVPNMSYKKVN